MDMDMNGDHGDSDDGGDGEGVWSPDIEQCFREALLLFPPCGRRKHILQEEGGGKMYGRNELIARHIKMRTGKTRTRKQVSSHIQVLARRKAKAEGTPSSMSGISPSPSSLGGLHSGNEQGLDIPSGNHLSHNQRQDSRDSYLDVWMDRPIVTRKIRLVEFSAFIDYPTNYGIGGYQMNAPNVVLPTGPSNMMSSDQLMQSSKTQQDLIDTKQEDTTNGIPRTIDVSHHSQVHGTYGIVGSQNQLHPQANPLGSNHHLTAQFNQATGYMTANSGGMNLGHIDNAGQRLADHHGQHNQTNQNNNINNNNNQQLQRSHHQQTPSTGFSRHYYIKIDYSLQANNQRQPNNRLVESIDINQIFDKFPEIGGSEGLFQRGQSDAFFLVKFWADINSKFEYDVGDQNSFFGYSSHFETSEPYRDITCSTKVCSYGNPLVEKVEKIEGIYNQANGRHSFRITRSPMCDFMVEFIRKLRQVPTLSLMNSVLENFTVLQVISSESTSEILLCLAYVFEIFPPTGDEDRSTGPQYHVYKLTKD